MRDRTLRVWTPAAAGRPLPSIPPLKASQRIAEREAQRRARMGPPVSIVEQWTAWRAGRRAWFSGSPAAGR